MDVPSPEHVPAAAAASSQAGGGGSGWGSGWGLGALGRLSEVAAGEDGRARERRTVRQ